MKFFAYVHQPGGCDYTIECGSLLINLKAQNLKEAKIELEEIIKEQFQGEQTIDSAIIISGDSFEIDLDVIYDKILEEEEQEEENEKEKKEREIYDRLKKKYES